jgi:hypothetical protein
VITRRGENIRLISVRRSRDEEVAIYEQSLIKLWLAEKLGGPVAAGVR